MLLDVLRQRSWSLPIGPELLKRQPCPFREPRGGGENGIDRGTSRPGSEFVTAVGSGRAQVGKARQQAGGHERLTELPGFLVETIEAGAIFLGDHLAHSIGLAADSQHVEAGGGACLKGSLGRHHPRGFAVRSRHEGSTAVAEPGGGMLLLDIDESIRLSGTSSRDQDEVALRSQAADAGDPAADVEHAIGFGHAGAA